MNEITVNQATLAISSLDIAERTGKAHKNVLADIRKMLTDLGLSSAEFSAQYIDSTGRKLECFNLPKREALILATGYSTKLRASIIDRIEELETRQHRIPTNSTVVPKDLLARCMYLGPVGRPTAQGKYLAKLQLPTIGQLGVTNSFGLKPCQLDEVEHESLLSLYARQDLEFRRGAESLMLDDQRRLEAQQRQKAKAKLQKRIAQAQAKLVAQERLKQLA